MPRQLREFRPEEIYSQAQVGPVSQYEVDGSFVVDEVEAAEETQTLSPLSRAEMVLEIERKEKKRRRKLYS